MTISSALRIIGTVMLGSGFLLFISPDTISFIAEQLKLSEVGLIVFWFVTMIVAGGLVSFLQPRAWGVYRVYGWIPFLLLVLLIVSIALFEMGVFGPSHLGSLASWVYIVCITLLLPLCVLGYVILGMMSFISIAKNDSEYATRCMKCGYNLYGLTEPRCPECGTPFDPKLNEEQSEDSASVTDDGQNRP